LARPWPRSLARGDAPAPASPLTHEAAHHAGRRADLCLVKPRIAQQPAPAGRLHRIARQRRQHHARRQRLAAQGFVVGAGSYLVQQVHAAIAGGQLPGAVAGLGQCGAQRVLPPQVQLAHLPQVAQQMTFGNEAR